MGLGGNSGQRVSKTPLRENWGLSPAQVLAAPAQSAPSVLLGALQWQHFARGRSLGAGRRAILFRGLTKSRRNVVRF
jgi:hypothetical protein